MHRRIDQLAHALSDGASAAHEGAGQARKQYRESRRRRGESDAFATAYSRADGIDGWLGRGEAESLFELSRALPHGCDAVEVGSYLGRSTAFLAMGLPVGSMLHAVDPHTGDRTQVDQGVQGIDTSAQFRRNMASLDLAAKVKAHVAPSVDAAHGYRGRPVGLLFVDGWHSEDAVYQDGHAWSPHLTPGAVVVFDDVGLDEVARGVRRLVDEGVVASLSGWVGKIGLCGPSTLWPPRVVAIARPA